MKQYLEEIERLIPNFDKRNIELEEYDGEMEKGREGTMGNG